MDYPYGALLDARTYTVLTVSRGPGILSILHECTPNTVIAFNIQYPHYTGGIRTFYRKIHPIFSTRTTGADYIRWKYSFSSQLFSRKSVGNETSDLPARARLATVKRDALSTIMRYTNAVQVSLLRETLAQEVVYALKRDEAMRFRDSGFNEKDVMEYPFVFQYADFAGVSLQQAAEDIIFKAKLRNEQLAQSELVRLRHFSLIKSARSQDEVSKVLLEFSKDYYRPA